MQVLSVSVGLESLSSRFQFIPQHNKTPTTTSLEKITKALFKLTFLFYNAH